jgi:hypothetical protein
MPRVRPGLAEPITRSANPGPGKRAPQESFGPLATIGPRLSPDLERHVSQHQRHPGFCYVDHIPCRILWPRPTASDPSLPGLKCPVCGGNVPAAPRIAGGPLPCFVSQPPRPATPTTIPDLPQYRDPVLHKITAMFRQAPGPRSVGQSSAFPASFSHLSGRSCTHGV